MVEDLHFRLGELRPRLSASGEAFVINIDLAYVLSSPRPCQILCIPGREKLSLVLAEKVLGFSARLNLESINLLRFSDPFLL